MAIDKDLEAQFQESLNEWAEIEKQTAIREAKDKKIISQYCAKQKYEDVQCIIKRLEENQGMPDHDKETVEIFKNHYPDSLTVKMISDFEDTKNVFQEYLEFGEEEQ